MHAISWDMNIMQMKKYRVHKEALLDLLYRHCRSDAGAGG
jgi:hypothetical protein